MEELQVFSFFVVLPFLLADKKNPGDTTEPTHVKVLVLETRTPRTVHQVRVSFNSTTTKPHQREVPCCTVQILLLQL